MPLDVGLLSGYRALSGGYTVHSPTLNDKMWHSPLPGWQSIPDLWFLHGLCLPMHPSFEDVLGSLVCGIGQLSPNLVLQISGFIAHCHELNRYPTLNLFFSIYRLKSTGVQVYFDARAGYSKLMSTPSSDSGWHPKWEWYEGGELNRISSWRRLSPDVVKSLGNVASAGSINLSAFCGMSRRYSAGQFADVGFLCSHSCKA